MKKLYLYSVIPVLIFIAVLVSEELIVKYLAFSNLVFIPIGVIAIISLYLVISMYKQQCFWFNKIAIILVIFIFLYLSASKIVNAAFDKEKIFEQEILSINTKLPMMIDKNIRFDKVYLKDGNIFYLYTITNIDAKRVNQDLITLMLTDKIYGKNGIIDKMILRLSDRKRVIRYIFKDKNENFLTKVEIKSN